MLTLASSQLSEEFVHEIARVCDGKISFPDYEVTTINFRNLLDYIMKELELPNIHIAKNILEDIFIINAENDMGVSDIHDEGVYGFQGQYDVTQMETIRKMANGYMSCVNTVIIGWLDNTLAVVVDIL